MSRVSIDSTRHNFAKLKMEENKCSKGGECEKCKDCKMCMFCPCHWSGHQCRVMRIIMIIVVLLVVFSLGASYGKHKNGFEERGYGQKYMMNRGYNQGGFENSRTGGVTVQVAPSSNPIPAAPTTPIAQ